MISLSFFNPPCGFAPLGLPPHPHSSNLNNNHLSGARHSHIHLSTTTATALLQVNLCENSIHSVVLAPTFNYYLIKRFFVINGLHLSIIQPSDSSNQVCGVRFGEVDTFENMNLGSCISEKSELELRTLYVSEDRSRVGLIFDSDSK